MKSRSLPSSLLLWLGAFYSVCLESPSPLDSFVLPNRTSKTSSTTLKCQHSKGAKALSSGWRTHPTPLSLILVILVMLGFDPNDLRGLMDRVQSTVDSLEDAWNATVLPGKGPSLSVWNTVTSCMWFFFSPFSFLRLFENNMGTLTIAVSEGKRIHIFQYLANI